MRFAENNSPPHSIQSWNKDGVVINDRLITHSVLVSADRVQAWSPTRITELSAENFTQFESLKPEIVIIGTGKTLVFPAPHLLVVLQSQGIGIEIMANDAACRTFNVLLSEDRRVLLALMIDQEPAGQVYVSSQT